MLQFLQRHQKYFFIVITIIIVISFSFFGTYGTLVQNNPREQVAFTTVTGQTVSRHEVDELIAFISTDAQDKLAFGGAWGPNFLNDGVIQKEFIQNGLLSVLAQAYAPDVQSDLNTRLEKEKRFQPYQHPTATFISSEQAWKYFYPEMSTSFTNLRQAKDPIDPYALAARTNLFLQQKQFPPGALRQVLRYQEKQANWPQPDSNLSYVDLSLFGYHTVEDWFGPRLIRLIGQFILNAAAIAEKQGYEVSKAEALADLRRNAEQSFRQLNKNGQLGVANATEYYQEQLRRMNMDQNEAAKVWRQVLLFRRLFQDRGETVFLDPVGFQPFLAYAKETLEGDLYRLPDALRLKDYASLQKFEVYLDAVSKRDKDKLALPTTFLSVEEVTKKAPELVQKQYLVEVKSVDKKELATQVSLKETWNWEVEDQNWEALKKRFPEIATKAAKTREERLTILDQLDDKTRARVDNMARNAIVEAQPELIKQALAQAKGQRQVLVLPLKGPAPGIAGLDNAASLIALLDTATLNASPSGELAQYSANGKNYYAIEVLARENAPGIATFAQANREGILDKLLTEKLEAHYVKMREKNAEEFQKEDKSWKPLADVRARVADDYFAAIKKAIKADYAAAILPLKPADSLPNDQLATMRLFAYGRSVKERLQKGEDATALVKTSELSASPSNQLQPREDLAAQWKMILVPFTLDRSSSSDLADKMEAFAIADNQWTKVHTPPGGDVSFFHLKNKKEGGDNLADVQALLGTAKEMISAEAQQTLMRKMLVDIKAKNALSLQYLNPSAESIEP